MSETNNYRRPHKTATKVAGLGLAVVLLSGTVAAGIPTANVHEAQLASTINSVINKDLPYWASDADKSALTDKFQGSIRELYIAPEKDAELRSLGINIDWAKSLEVTNAHNEANNTSVVLLVVEYDNEQFNASEYGPLMDIETTVTAENGAPYGHGLSLDTSDFDYDVSVNAPAFADTPSQTKGQKYTGLGGRVAPQNFHEKTWIEVNGVKASKLANASPVVETIDGGLPSNTGSHTELRSETTSEFTKTIQLDNYSQTAERQADLKASGLRTINPDNAVDITERDDTIVRMVPVATGLDREELADQETSGNDYQVTPINLALMDPIDVHVVSDRKKERNAHIGEANAYKFTSGFGQAFLKPTTTAPGENGYFGYNFSDPNVGIVPVDPSMVVNKPFAGNLQELSITADGDTVQINNRWTSDFTGSSTQASTTKGPVDTDTSKEEARLEKDRNDLASLQDRKAEFTLTLADARASYDEAFANGASDEELERLQARIDNAENSIMELDDLIPEYEKRVANSEKALAEAKDRPSDSYTFTYTHIGSNSGAEGPKSWGMNNAELPVGQSWVSSVNGIDATFTVVKNEAGQLVVEMKLSEVPTRVTEMSGNGSIGTGMYIQGNATTFMAPGYDTFWTELTPEVPTPEQPPVVVPPTPEVPTPEVPTPELPPVQIEVPPTTDTSISITPSDSSSDGFDREPLSDSAIDNIEDNKGLLLGIGGLAGLLMAAVFAMKRNLSLRNREDSF